MNAPIDQIERAVENVRPRNQDHAGTHDDQPQRRAQVIPRRETPDEAGQQSSAKRLDEDIRAHSTDRAAKQAARTCAGEDQRRGWQVLNAEDDCERDCTGCRGQGK